MSGRRLLMAAAAVAVSAAVGAIAGMRPSDPVCDPPADGWQPLSINRAADVDHLRDDVARARAAARAFADAVASRPVFGDSIDVQEGARTAPGRARAWCEAMLATRIASDHQLPLEAVRAEFGPEIAQPPMPQVSASQADAEPTSGSTPVSPVVSRPSR
jgi:hypothetical protein